MKVKKRTYEVVIGLEVHVQLSTRSKIFSSDHNRFGDEPNINLSPITIAHPGTLPLPNKEVVTSAVKMGLALGCKINSYVIFDRKNYFYPDLPKGYQLTQDTSPICTGGGLSIRDENGEPYYVALTKIHMEEDAGKSIHVDNASYTQIDLNRAGVPLIEIVTEPVLRTPKEAMDFMTEIRRIVRYLEIGDGNMEQGSLRCDANVSIRQPGAPLGNKVELKNMNSFKHVGKAIEHEIDRQTGLANSGKEILSESRTFNPETGGSIGMRTKEVLNDYRYFPEPDISPLDLDKDWIESIRSSMPGLPSQYRLQLTEKYKLPPYDVEVLVEDKGQIDFFLEVASHCHHYKQISNWIMGPVKKYLNQEGKDISELPISATKMADIIELVETGQISKSAATQKLFEYLIDHPDLSVHESVNILNLGQEGNSNTILLLVNEVLDKHPEKVKAYHSGKKGLTGMFMGELMKKSSGKLDPKVASQLIIETLESRR